MTGTGFGLRGPRRLDERLLLDGQPAIGIGRVLLELVVDPVRRGADAAVGVGLGRQRVTRPERGQCGDRILDVRGTGVLSMCRTSGETGGPWSSPPSADRVPSAMTADAASTPVQARANSPYASFLIGPPPG